MIDDFVTSLVSPTGEEVQKQIKQEHAVDKLFYNVEVGHEMDFNSKAPFVRYLQGVIDCKEKNKQAP